MAQVPVNLAAIPGGQQVQPIIIQTVASGQTGSSCCARSYDGLRSRVVMACGCIQLLAGISCIVLNSIGIPIHVFLSVVGHGIWCGILFIITGSFGIFAGKNKTLCPILTFMILSILSVVMTSNVISFAAIGVDAENYNNYYYRTYSKNEYGNWGYQHDTSNLLARKAIHILLITVGLIEIIDGIVSAALCCHAMCCCRRPAEGQVIYNGQYINAGAGQSNVIVIHTTGQAMGGEPHVVYQQASAAGYAQQPAPVQDFTQPMAPPPYTNPSPPPDYQPESFKKIQPENSQL